MKNTRLGVASAAALALTVTGCSSETDSAAEEGMDAGADSTSDAAQEAGAFPATVETAFGPVTIEEESTTVVALGWGDAETALALGVEPVGASDWLGFSGDGVGPWAEGMYSESPTLIGTLEPSFEEIAALEPDLILDVKSSGEQERYDRLSEIAPTVGVPEGGESYLTTPDQQVEMISTALGVPEEGEELQSEVDAAFDEAAAAHPEWEGLTVAAATKTSEGWGAYVEGGQRVQFLQRLGFVQSPKIAELPVSETGFSVDISSERLDLLDADVIVAFPIFIEQTEITEDPLWANIPAVADDRAIVMGGDLSQAYATGTTMAQLYAIEELVPLLEDVTE